jgi:hypothetical protein
MKRHIENVTAFSSRVRQIGIVCLPVDLIRNILSFLLKKPHVCKCLFTCPNDNDLYAKLILVSKHWPPKIKVQSLFSISVLNDLPNINPVHLYLDMSREITNQNLASIIKLMSNVRFLVLQNVRSEDFSVLQELRTFTLSLKWIDSTLTFPSNLETLSVDLRTKQHGFDFVWQLPARLRKFSFSDSSQDLYDEFEYNEWEDRNISNVKLIVKKQLIKVRFNGLYNLPQILGGCILSLKVLNCCVIDPPRMLSCANLMDLQVSDSDDLDILLETLGPLERLRKISLDEIPRTDMNFLKFPNLREFFISNGNTMYLENFVHVVKEFSQVETLWWKSKVIFSRTSQHSVATVRTINK